MTTIAEESLRKHKEWRGKIEVISRAPITTKEELALAYTPGVAEPCLRIKDDPDLSYEYTRRGNLVAVITDGTAVLGLGDIGGLAGMPVMEGKCALFKEFAGVDAFPLCIKTKDTSEFIRTVELLSDSFGGINLEDIAAPRCFEIERELKKRLSIPVFHDDQHGTAVVAAAALINALKVAEIDIHEATAVINGAGAAGISVARQFLALGVGDVRLVDLCGCLNADETYDNAAHAEISKLTNKKRLRGGLKDALVGADVFVGVSKPGVLNPEWLSLMNSRPIVFAMANPLPEIMPDEAKQAGAFIVGTGRSDFPNQINNLLAFPGIFKGALMSRARDITEEMKVAATYAIAAVAEEDGLSTEYIIPSPLDRRVADRVAEAVSYCSV
ncbi:MAG: NADP-dependent malic enzyme [Oscillospiraceae bacterium]|jgi:malate dehydrogenase (oxaloacetate-decarboxylating)|nr:NADP-dependent malic enzyme [Oscillospiraceae bacterium]